MTDFYTYLHCKPNGDLFYVGKGTGKRSHDLHRRSTHHKAIVAKYGIEIFVFPCESEEQAFADEIQQIAQLRRDGYNLCNQSLGGELGPFGCVRSDETRKKLSAALSGRKLSSEHCANIGKAVRGTARCLGYKHSDETRAKLSAALKGNKRAVGNKNALGHSVSAEAREKMSSVNIGRAPWNKGLSKRLSGKR